MRWQSSSSSESTFNSTSASAALDTLQDNLLLPPRPPGRGSNIGSRQLW
jgi:hypothetical protein